jgi:serine palmitoyltransferase
MSKPVINMASYNFTNLAGNEEIRDKAIDTLRKYGLGSCGPPGFYGTMDVHMQLERDLAEFLGTESAILYSQSFSTVPSVISAFAKRHDVIVADRGVSFAIHKGLQISRSTIRWYDHNDPKSLEDVLISVEKERKKRRAPLTRRFIVTEGIFEKDGAMIDLPKIIELKKKYKFRLILDESMSFGTVGRTGRGLTELYNAPASEVDILVGSVANTLNSSGGFCAGSRIVTEHQRINGTSFVFSAAGPPLLAVSASEGIHILRNTPSLLTTLQENVHAARGVLEKSDVLEIPSHPASAVIHLNIRNNTLSSQGLLDPNVHRDGVTKSNPLSLVSRSNTQGYEQEEERLLQEIVDECLAQGVWITRAKRLHGQEPIETRPSIKLAISAGLTRKEVEKAAGVVKAVAGKILGRRRV